MMSGNMDVIRMQIQGMHARFTQATARPNLTHGEVGQASNTGAYQSWAQVTEAMKNPKYREDPAYRAEVERRMSISKLEQ